jgi:lipoprotein
MSEKSQKKKTLCLVLTGIIGLAACIGIYCGYQAHMRKAEELRQEKSRVEREAKRAAEEEERTRKMQEILDNVKKRTAQKQAAQKHTQTSPEQRNAKLKAEINLENILLHVDTAIENAVSYQYDKEAKKQAINKFGDFLLESSISQAEIGSTSKPLLNQAKFKLWDRLAKFINGMSDEDQKNMSPEELQAAKNIVTEYAKFEKAYRDFTTRYGELK